MFDQVKKAVIPAAGFGSRMLPFTKAVPKELIPLVDKPVIQYVVEEAVAAGIEEILIVVSSGKEAIMRHFNPAFDLETRLEHDGKTALLAEIRAIDRLAKIHYVWQQELKGLGDAVLQAEAFVGSEPFALLLGDTVMDSSCDRSVTGQLVDVHARFGGSAVALERVPKEKLSRYGVVGGKTVSPRVVAVETMVEKPAPEEAPSDLAVAARYLFTPAIFRYLAMTPPGKGGEIQLTDAMKMMLQAEPLYGCEVAGHRYDIGSKSGFVVSNVEFALRRAELAPEIRKKLQTILNEEKK